MTGNKLDEELPELRQDRVFHISVDAAKQVNHIGARCRASIAERYVRGGVELHFHARIGLPQGDTEDICAVFKRAEIEFRREDGAGVRDKSTGGVSLSYGVAGMACGRTDDAKVAMPVDSGEFIENPKGVGVCLKFPSLVRLQTLNVCLGVWVDCINFLESTPVCQTPALVPFVEGVVSARDGKRGIGGRIAPNLRDTEFPSEMVQSGSHVLETVPDDERQRLRRLLNHVSPDNILRTIRPSLMGDSVRLEFEEFPDLMVQCHQMLIRPVELEPDPLKRVLSW